MPELARLRWLCRRGMKELDVVLSRYLEQRYASASNADQAQFRALLELPDPDLYNLLLGRDTAPDPECARFLQGLRTGPGPS